MNKVRYETNTLKFFLKKERISTMPKMKKALAATANRTVTRKLNELSYMTSYSHGSSFYTLEEFAKFDEKGLWACRSVWFSQHGTLRSTLRYFVTTSEAGYSAGELKECLHVSVKETLLKLVNSGEIVREKAGGIYIYFSQDASERKRQLLAHRVTRSEEEKLADEVKAAIIIFVSLLDEKQRRLYAGLESLKAGTGGDIKIAELLGLHSNTVARGRRELLTQDIELNRIRKAGGGRRDVKKTK